MDLNHKPTAAAPTAARNIFPTTRHHHRKPISSDRFFGVPPHPHRHPESTFDTELTEHDIFCSSPDFSSTSSSTHHTPIPSPSTSLISHSHNNHGILAALPVGDESEIHSVFNHKASSASVSSPSTSSLLSTPSSISPASRLIVTKRPPPPPRMLHQSAPVNVPVLSEAMRRSRAARGLDDVMDDSDEDEDDYTGEILPPHEIIAAKETDILSCSVMEGVGRTLKGRDLRHVRNAVWQTTGFQD